MMETMRGVVVRTVYWSPQLTAAVAFLFCLNLHTFAQCPTLQQEVAFPILSRKFRMTLQPMAAKSAQSLQHCCGSIYRVIVGV